MRLVISLGWCMPRRDRPINPFETIPPPMSKADRQRAEARRDPAKRNKKRSDVPGTALLTREPPLTPAFAAEFVKLLHAGISPLHALAYFAPQHFDSLDRSGRLAWLSKWERDPLMATASVSFMKGLWQDLDKDTRLEIALDKHMAELAFLLYSSNYKDAEGTELKKLDSARDAITQWISQGDESADTPYVRALRDLLEGKLHDSLGPPQLSIGMSIPAEKVKLDS